MSDQSGRKYMDIARKSRELRRKAVKLAGEIEARMESDDFDLLKEYTDIRIELSEWSRMLDEKNEVLSQRMQSLGDQHDQAAEGFIDKLRRYLLDNSHEVFGEESLLIVDGVVYIECDVRKPRVTINGENHAGMNIEAIESSVSLMKQSIQVRSTEPAEFLNQLRRAYLLAISENGSGSGAEIEMIKLLPYLLLGAQSKRFLSDPSKSSFVEYPYYVFRADLYSLFRAGVKQTEGMEMRWSSGSNTKGAVFMYVPALGRVAHVGRICFQRTGD